MWPAYLGFGRHNICVAGMLKYFQLVICIVMDVEVQWGVVLVPEEAMLGV